MCPSTVRTETDRRSAMALLVIPSDTMIAISSSRPVSGNALTAPFRRQTATLEALRVDRQLDEALTHGPDPLHLAVVFGLDETTAIRYSQAARKLLHTPAEQHGPQS